jgi:hypothetical protein
MLMKRIFISVALIVFYCLHVQAQAGAHLLKTPWIINDNFSANNYNWYEDSTKTYEVYVRNNHYSLWNKDTSARSFVHSFNQSFENNDYKIEAYIEHSTGGESKGSGLIIGADELLKSYYRFVISKDGYFLIDKIENNTKSTLHDWKYSNAINNGNANALSVVKFGNHWSFRINDVIVYSTDAMQFFGNRHGFYVAPSSGIYCTSFKIYDITLAKTDTKLPKENIYDAAFFDNFSNNDNEWEIEENDKETTSVSNGFHLQNKTEGFYAAWKPMPVSDILNHRIETTVAHIDGVEDRAFGICFGLKDVDNLYMFCISADGSFLIGQFMDGEYKRVNKWTESDAIRKGNYSTNTLAFEKTDKWYFYINGVLVYSCERQAYLGNKFGLYVENKQTAEFKDLKLSSVTVF